MDDEQHVIRASLQNVDLCQIPGVTASWENEYILAVGFTAKSDVQTAAPAGAILREDAHDWRAIHSCQRLDQFHRAEIVLPELRCVGG
ncbi:MAG TPA: hypothetical protein VF879_05140, partial [Nitrospirales bacterium]